MQAVDEQRGSTVQTSPALDTGAWFALRTAPRHEKRVHERLIGQGIESFLPLCERISRWTDRRKRIEVALFPGYCFARFERLRRIGVVKTGGVIEILGTNNVPESIPDSEIEGLKRVMQSRLPYEASLTLRPGMAVEVTRGPLAGVRGTLIRHDGRCRLLIAIDLIRQGAVVDIDAADVAAV